MKTLIAIPCMDMLPAVFLRSLLRMQIIGEVDHAIVTSSLIYDARNQILQHAVNGGYDYILWLDSDMEVPTDTMPRLMRGIDAGFGMMSGLYFKRVPPYDPVIYRRCELVRLEDGKLDPQAEIYDGYPRGQIFEIAACGFGCCLMSRELAARVTERFGLMPFMPAGGFGEDLSFCMRAQQAGERIGCDSGVRAGHIGRMVFNEDWYDRIRKENGHGDNAD